MEGENNWWTVESTWSISCGTIVNTVTVESSISPVETKDSSCPLIVHPPSPDYGPCEITISFRKIKHELRQVYVRSSARVYEIYYSPDSQSNNNEYLSTVRCGTVDEQLNVEGCKDNSNIGASEDDWVEVKALDSPIPDDTVRGKQSLYEATAEISDSDPCVSVTIRLLSLEYKGCVCVDEIYVFADPVDSCDSGNQIGEVENSAVNSSMAMFLPVLMRLSKAGVSQRPDNCTVDVQREHAFLDVGSRETDQINTANKDQLEACVTEQHEVKNAGNGETAWCSIPARVSDAGSKPDAIAKETDIERVLERLLDRVGKIENVLLRFEEKMLKPISSIEVRLQRVEDQLEALSMNSRDAGFPSCSRFSAPAFSCDDSCVNSFHQDGSDYPGGGVVMGLEKMDTNPDAQPDGTHVNDNQLVPGLVVTAPEFANFDEEEDLDVRDSPRINTTKPANMSIDDALASALAGFLSSTQPDNLTQTLSIKAPEFLNDEDGDKQVRDSPGNQFETVTSSFIIHEKPDETECTQGSVSAPSMSPGSRDNMDGYLKDDFHDRDERKCGRQIDQAWIDSAEYDVSPTDISERTEDVSENVETMMQQVTDISKSLETRTADRSDTTDKVTAASKDPLQDVFEFSHTALEVDFNMPILDVTFGSRENSITKSSPIEALLCDVVEFNTEASTVEETDVKFVCQEEYKTEAASVEETNVNFVSEETFIKTSLIQESVP